MRFFVSAVIGAVIGFLGGHTSGWDDAMATLLTRCFDQNAKLISTLQTKAGVQCNFANGIGHATFRRNATK